MKYLVEQASNKFVTFAVVITIIMAILIKYCIG